MNLKDKLSMATRGSYVHNSGKIFGGIPKSLILCNFLQMVSDKIIHKAFRTHTTLWTKPIREFFIFTIYQNYTLALNLTDTLCM